MTMSFQGAAVRPVAATRNTISSGVLGADQKISRKEALRVETINNAYLTFEERTKGSSRLRNGWLMADG